MTAQSPCPTFEEACEEVGQALMDACPPDGDYRNHGQYNKCRNQALKDLVDVYDGCFTLEELTAMRDCAKAWADSLGEPGNPPTETELIPTKPDEPHPRFHRE